VPLGVRRAEKRDDSGFDGRGHMQRRGIAGHDHIECFHERHQVPQRSLAHEINDGRKVGGPDRGIFIFGRTDQNDFPVELARKAACKLAEIRRRPSLGFPARA
jgi:hypothetical protein